MTPPNGLSRRGMLVKLGILFNGAVGILLALPVVGYILSPVMRARKAGYDSWLSLGPLTQFPEGETRLATFRNPVVEAADGETANIPCWVRRVAGEKFQVFAINCAHLGCPVRWFPQSGLFMCPCHGGVYYEDGSRASGPPERGLFRISLQSGAGQSTDPSGRDADHRRSHRAPDQHLPRKTAMRLIKTIGDWFDERLQLAQPIRETMQHPVPRETASWAYVFGSAALTYSCFSYSPAFFSRCFMCPPAGEAWNSLQMLNHQVPLGWFIRALHGWGSNFMVAIVLIHMVQVFLFGAYKFPRELTWIVGVFLLLMTLGMAFTGQVLRFDQDAYWGLGIGASICEPRTVVGPGW